MVAGLACLWLGEILGAWLMPINKSLWTPAYAFAMTGWACLMFGLIYWLLDAMPRPLLRARLAEHLPQARHVEGDRFGSIGIGLALDAQRKFG
jgi:predicted acyltransferase